MVTAKDIIDTIGRARLSALLGVGKTAISNAVVSNAIPAKWYSVFEAECERLGIDCPKELFTFIAIDESAA